MLARVCGICGHTHDPRGSAVAAMNDAMVARGPDDGGAYVDRGTGVALGARRLSIIDVDGGHQPLANEDGTVWAVLNGEIYNHPRLQERLRSRGHTLRTGTDTEVLVHLYEDHGDALVHALEGMYAFAIWDSARHTLLVARDRIGEKPLFYARDGDALAFASELTPLLRGGLRPALDPAAVDQFFVFGYVPSPTAIAGGVEQLPPAHLMRWQADTGELTIERYWSAPRERGHVGHDRGLLVHEVRALLEESVRSRLIADVPLGVFLSGGLDSTLIATLAARAAAAPLKTFTVGYESVSVSELGPARRASQVLGTDHYELVLSDSEVVDSLPRVFARLDQPLADQALAPLHAVSTLARRHVTVAVGGEGADELFGGYPRYRWLARAEAAERIPAAVARPLATAVRGAGGEARWRRLADVLEPRETLDRHLLWVTDRRGDARTELYGPALREWSTAGGARASLADRIAAANGADPVTRFMRLDLEHWLPDDVLTKADRAGMLASLEIRTPFLQRELIELATTLPPEVHLEQGGKSLLRAVLDDVAPEVAWKRAKTAFRVPAAEWLRGGLGNVLLEQTDGGRLYREGWFDPDAVRTVLAEHRAGAVGLTAQLWPLLVLGCWYEAQDGIAGA